MEEASHGLELEGDLVFWDTLLVWAECLCVVNRTQIHHPFLSHPLPPPSFHTAPNTSSSSNNPSD